MKLLCAIIQPTKLHTVREALKQAGFDRLTVCGRAGFWAAARPDRNLSRPPVSSKLDPQDLLGDRRPR